MQFNPVTTTFLDKLKNYLDQPKPTKTSKPTKAGSRVFPPEEKQ